MLLLAIFVYLLTEALQVLPIGTAYAVWIPAGAMHAKGGQRFEPGPRKARTRTARSRSLACGSASGMTGVMVSDPEGLTPFQSTGAQRTGTNR